MEKEHIFKNNSKKYFYYPLFLCFVIDLLLSLGFYLIIPDISIGIALKIFSSAFLFSSFLYKIPLILIFVNHIRYSFKKRVLLISKNEHFYIVIDSIKEKIEIPYQSINEINTFLGPPGFDKRMSWVFWDSFFYYKIRTSTNESYVISCLICNTLFEHIPEEKNIRHKIIFPIIFLPRSH